MARGYLFSVLGILSFNTAMAADLKPCGLSGPVPDRIQNCRTVNGTDSVRANDWVLVSRAAGTDAEAWMESDSDLIWLSPEPGLYTWQEARDVCQTKGLWLPSRYEFDRADSEGIRQVLPFLRRKLWWTFTESDFEGAAYFFNGTRGYTDDGNQTERHRAMCTIKIHRDSE